MAVQTGAPRRSKRWVWWLVGGFAICVLLLTAGIGFALGSVLSGAAVCAPSDFPKYPHSLWGGGSATVSGCRMAAITFDGSDRIIDFYGNRLSTGSWAVGSINRVNHRIDFQHVRGTRITGVLWLVDQGPFRAICSEFDRSTTASGAWLAVQTTHNIPTRTTSRPVCESTGPPAS